MIEYAFYGLIAGIILYVIRNLYITWRDAEFGDDDYDGGL